MKSPIVKLAALCAGLVLAGCSSTVQEFKQDVGAGYSFSVAGNYATIGECMARNQGLAVSSAAPMPGLTFSLTGGHDIAQQVYAYTESETTIYGTKPRYRVELRAGGSDQLTVITVYSKNTLWGTPQIAEDGMRLAATTCGGTPVQG